MTLDDTELKRAIRENYGSIAVLGGSCCQPTGACGNKQAGSCCGQPSLDALGKEIGYSEEDLGAAPAGANMGLGCGNPVALASLRAGETVLDLGSGGGFDCFLASTRVGAQGRVIGVDMTSEMLEKARRNAKEGGYTNVEFRLGEIENLPVADNSVDVIISNCVVNLTPNKRRVFEEAYRVLKPGGRLMVSDIVLLRPLPEGVRESVAAYVGCVAGAELKGEYLQTIGNAGFAGIEVVEEAAFGADFVASFVDVAGDTAADVAGSVVSIKVRGVKPVSGDSD
jgi:SAM-dependent methyltransferase